MSINPPVRHIKVFGWRIYFSRSKMRRCAPSLNRHKIHRRRHVNNLSRKKLRRYKQTGGCCQICGHHGEIGQMEMHHILPIAVFPELGNEITNMILLCRQCHFLVHHNPMLNLKLMSRQATQNGIDLSKRYHKKAMTLWETSQACQQQKMEIENMSSSSI